jgi:hypothetical protein
MFSFWNCPRFFLACPPFGQRVMMPEFRLQGQGYLLTWVKLVQDLGVRFVHGQEGMAGIAVLRDFTPFF